jgi:mRNA interferase MazF
VISERWDVVIVPFPFTDRPAAKRRPALTLSQREFNAHGHSVLAMITTKVDPPWPGDTPLADPVLAGLPASSTVRLKLFTLDNRLIAKVAGALADDDRARVAAQLHRFLA